MIQLEGAWPEFPDDRPVTAETTVTLAGPPVDRRDDWGALPPKSNAGGFASLDATVCHYTAANRGYMVDPADDHEQCRAQTRAIQQQHQSLADQSDIEYNALACSHGYLLEGRVLGRKGGANGTADSNATMPSICLLIGVNDLPTDAMYGAVAWFHAAVEAKTGVVLPMFGHRDVYATSCPGDLVYGWILNGGYRIDWPQPNPGDDMTFLIGVTNHPGYPPPLQVVYVANWLERRWVRTEDELAVMRRAGLGEPLAVDYSTLPIDTFGVLVGPSP